MVSDISHSDFKDVIEKFVQKMGFNVESSTLLSDGSVDFKAVTSNPMGASVVSVIRASTNPSLVNEDEVLDLYQKMKEIKGVRAAYITTSGFSGSAIEAARDKPISLINKYQLIDSLEKRGLLSDSGLMQSLEKFGMAEKHFLGYENCFISSKDIVEVRQYFDMKASKSEHVTKLTGRYAPIEVFKINTQRNVWTGDHTLRTVEKKDYVFINLSSLDLYYISIKRKKNQTEYHLNNTDIIRQIHDLPVAAKEHLLHLLDHGDLPLENIDGKELSILKNKRVIEIYEGKKFKGDSFTDYADMILHELQETINLAVKELTSALTSLGETSDKDSGMEKKPKKVTAQINLPHMYGGIYDIWKYMETKKGIDKSFEIDQMNYTSKEVGDLLATLFGGKTRREGIIFIPYFRARYMDENRTHVTKYEVLFTPLFKSEPTTQHTRQVHKPKSKKMPEVKGRISTNAGNFKLIR